MRDYTKTELQVIASINRQAENLSKSTELRYKGTSELYKKTLEIQLGILNGNFDFETATKIVSEPDEYDLIKLIVDRVSDNDSVIQIFKENPNITELIALEWLNGFSPDNFRTEPMFSHMKEVIQSFFNEK